MLKILDLKILKNSGLNPLFLSNETQKEPYTYLIQEASNNKINTLFNTVYFIFQLKILNFLVPFFFFFVFKFQVVSLISFTLWNNGRLIMQKI